MLKINLGNSNTQFPGFVNSADFFAQQGLTINNQSVLNGAELNHFPWPIADNSVSSAKLIYALETHHDNESLLKIMQELYRVCADGALIEVRSHSPIFLRSLELPYKFNIITDKILNFFNKDYRTKLREDAELLTLLPRKQDGSDLDVDFKILKHELNLAPHIATRIQNKEFKTNEELNTALNTDPRAINYQNFFLVASKNPDHHFAVGTVANLPHFMVRIQDPKLNRYGTFALRNNGHWDADLDGLFVNVLKRMAQHKAEYNQQLNFACVGANIGWYPLLATLIGENVHVDCFEPSPTCTEILQQNMELNDVANRVFVSSLAMSDQVGQSTLYINMEANGSDSLIKEANNETSEEISVSCSTLDNFYLNQNSDNWPSLLMMDTHGHEDRVFAGAKGMFERGYRPVIISEFNPKLLNLRGTCTFHHELIEKYEYSAFVLNYNGNANTNVFKVDVNFLDKAFDAIINNKSDKAMINVIFVPSWMNPETFRPY